MADNKGPASEIILGDLHSKVATVMINALDHIEKAQEVYEKTDVEILAEKGMEQPEINPALLSVMVRFLDANKITCAPAEGNGMSDLEKRLAAKAKGRRSVGNVIPIFETE